MLAKSHVVPLAAGLAGLLLNACTASAQASAASGFDRYFTGRTMRIDYFHTGRSDQRIVTLDRVVDDGPWPGSRTRLLDETNLGKYLVEVVDRATNLMIYSRGFATLYGEWETTPESATAWRTFHDSVRLPWPKAPVQVALKRREPDSSFREIWATAVDPASRFVNQAPLPARGRVWTVMEHGAPADKVDILLVGEGYTEAQLPKFHADVTRLVEALFRYEPFRSRRTDFNVRALDLPSPEQGAHRPQSRVDRRTPLSAEYNIFDSERYLLTQDNRALRDAASAAPYEFIEILINDEYYGGGGIFNAHATAAASNPFAEYLFVHEFAHHFAALADEYYTSDVAYATGAAEKPEPWEPNVTALRAPGGLKWADLVGKDTPVPTPWPKTEFETAQREYQKTRRELRASGAGEAEMTALFRAEQQRETALLSAFPFAGRVGAFEGASYESSGLYRPTADCIMFSRNDVGFCPVCQRALTRVIDLYSKP